MKYIAFILTMLLVCSFSARELIITEKGFDNVVIGETTLSQIKKKHPFAKRTRTTRHVHFRTDEGRVGRSFYYWTIKTGKGISYHFNHAVETTDPITLDAISFERPANVKTSKGISLGTSSFKDVENKYGVVPTSVFEDYTAKDYDSIVFYSSKLTAKDSIDENFIVTEICIKQ